MSENKFNNITEIRDFSAPELDVYARLSEVQLLKYYEPNGGLFIAESPKVITRALDLSYEPISALIDTRDIEGEGLPVVHRLEAEYPDVPIYTASSDILTKLTGFKLTRGMLCAMKRKSLPTAHELCAGARRIAVLEDVVNPTNMGAIVRSAAALNIDAILLTPGCTDPLYRRAIRVSMGTIFQIPWTYLTTSECQKYVPNVTGSAEHASCHISNNPGEHVPCHISNAPGEHAASSFAANKPSWPEAGMEFLKHEGFKTVAMALRDNSRNIDDPEITSQKKLAIILGTEGEGLCDYTISHCDYTVMIPMSHQVDSLNVAAASAVAFWELGR